MVDNALLEVPALNPVDGRRLLTRVAGPMALIVAKLHKIQERRGTSRLELKDAHDVYRLLVATSTEDLRDTARRLLRDELAAAVTGTALSHLGELFPVGPEAPGSTMAGENEALVGDPAVVAASVSIDRAPWGGVSGGLFGSAVGIMPQRVLAVQY